MDRACDVAIVGGGTAGAATALLLRKRTGLSVAILERAQAPGPCIGESISPQGRHLLNQLGVWSTFVQDAHIPSRGTCSYWGGATPGYNDYLWSPLGYGWHLDRRRFDSMLLREAVAQGAERLSSAQPWHWQPEPEGGYLLRRTGSGDSEGLRARFLVDATGYRASVAATRGARSRLFDRGLGFYGSFSIAADAARDSHALVEACPEGWWYSALVPGGRIVVGLMGDGDSLRRLKRNRREVWLAMLRQAPMTWRRLSNCQVSDDSLTVLPANVALREPAHGSDWLAVGDAASTYDPLSSQGVLKALDSAAAAGEALAQASGGKPQALQAYGQRVSAQFQMHLRTRCFYYGQEKRWPEAIYWKNRRAVHAAAPEQAGAVQ